MKKPGSGKEFRGEVMLSSADHTADIARTATKQATASSVSNISSLFADIVHSSVIFLYPIALTTKYLVAEEQKNADKLQAMSDEYSDPETSVVRKQVIKEKFKSWASEDENDGLRDKESFKQRSTQAAILLGVGVAIASITGVVAQVAFGNFVVGAFSLISAGKALAAAAKAKDMKGVMTNLAVAAVAIGFGVLVTMMGPLAGALTCSLGGMLLVADVNNDTNKAISSLNKASKELLIKTLDVNDLEKPSRKFYYNLKKKGTNEQKALYITALKELKELRQEIENKIDSPKSFFDTDLGIDIEDLKTAGYSVGELIKEGFTLEDFTNNNYTGKDVIMAISPNDDINIKDLKKAGFKAEQLKELGVSQEPNNQISITNGVAAPEMPATIKKLDINKLTVAEVAEGGRTSLGGVAKTIEESQGITAAAKVDIQKNNNYKLDGRKSSTPALTK